MSVRETVYELLKPLEEDGFEIWNIEYVREGREWQLRVYVDMEGGIGVDDCETISRFLSDRLDEENLIEEAYSLIVSSPGMDRRLVKDEHFVRYAGKPVEVALYKGFEGRKKFSALLGEKSESTLSVTPIDGTTLKPEWDEISIPLELVSKVNLMVIF